LGIKVIIINPGGYNTGFNEQFMRQKYEWMNSDSLYTDHMTYVRQEEERIIKRELKSTAGIAKQVVKAVEAQRPKRRYVAPKWEWVALPLFRWVG
jgi:hypothetical protein